MDDDFASLPDELEFDHVIWTMVKYDEGSNEKTSFGDVCHWIDFIACFMDMSLEDADWIPTFDMALHRIGSARQRFKGTFTVAPPLAPPPLHKRM